jgi:oxaloacetate decarboxylase beta subunit
MVHMPYTIKEASKATRILSIGVTVVVSSSRQSSPLILAFGNPIRESGAVERLNNCSNELANLTTLSPGFGHWFHHGRRQLHQLQPSLSCTRARFGWIRLVVPLGKLMYVISGHKFNPLIGAAGTAHSMSARIVQRFGQEYDSSNFPIDACNGCKRRRAVGASSLVV